ncbi:MAG: carboxypeptidase regulatory-like domain-containing protein [Candidatus Sulfopaludibacter sp.]|nr:carboxypeptidase regulatory-like domain-containing protein [Candidatus Sulfopaludibacter sp.]
MRTAAWFLLAATAGWAQADCVVRGVVTDQSTGKPVTNVKLFLVRQSSREIPSLLQRSGEQGGFCFETVDPGDYLLETQRAAYLDGTYGGGVVLAVRAGSELEPLSVKLVRRAILSGTVVEGDGEPFARAEVHVYRRLRSREDSGQDEVESQETDDRGVFRFGDLPPGTYYLGVTAKARDFNMPLLDAGGKPRQEGYTESFYSAAARFEDAKPVVLQAGKDVTGLLLTLRKTQFRHIAGKVVGAPEGAYLRLQHPDGTTSSGIRADGSFYRGGLEPGQYTVELRAGNLLRGKKEVDLSSGDADGVTITADQTAAADFTLPVQFRAEKAGEPYRPSSNTFLVLLKGNEARLAQMSADGTFQFTNLTPDLYRLERVWVGGDFYVKRILLGGESTDGRTLDLRNGNPGGMQIVVARKSAALTGRLVGDTPVLSQAVTILLIDDLGRIGESTHADQNGQFRMEHVAPGKYRLFALEQFESSNWDSDLADALQAKSLAVELGDGEMKKVELAPITAQEAARAVK